MAARAIELGRVPTADVKTKSHDNKRRDDIPSAAPLPKEHIIEISSDKKHAPLLLPSFTPPPVAFYHLDQIDPVDQREVISQFGKFIDKKGERSERVILAEFERILQNDVFQLKACDKAHFLKFLQNLFDKGHLSHNWVHAENIGANSTNFPWIFFAWATSIVGFVSFIKIFNPEAAVSESDLIAQFIGGSLAILNSFQWALLFSPKLEAIITSLETHFGKSRSERFREWLALAKRDPKAALLQLLEYLVTQTVQVVSNLTGGVAIPLGIYSYLENSPLDGAYVSALLTYLGGWVFFRNYLGKELAAAIRFFLDFEKPFMVTRLFTRRSLQAFNVLLEGLTTPIIKAYIVYPYISDLANATFGWFPTRLVMACVAIQQSAIYKKTYDNHIQFSIDLRKLLLKRKNIELLAGAPFLTPTETALIDRVMRFPRQLTKEQSKNYLILVNQLADSFEKLFVKLATQHLPVGYVWKKDWKVVVTDIFSSMVGGWVGAKISAAVLTSAIGAPLAISAGVIVGAVSLGGIFHLAEATTCDDRLAHRDAVRFFQQKTTERETDLQIKREEAFQYFRQLTETVDEKFPGDQKHPEDEKLIPLDVNRVPQVDSGLSWATIGKISLVTVLVLAFTGSTLFSEMGMVDTGNALILSIAAIGILKLLISNQKYNGEMNYDRVNRLNFNMGSCFNGSAQGGPGLFASAKVVPVESLTPVAPLAPQAQVDEKSSLRK